jgi:hypothetical protein
VQQNKQFAIQSQHHIKILVNFAVAIATDMPVPPLQR